ncbi:DUF2306 domain-containing protein [Muricauda sp. HICW]|uniref:DUF2306 domain-containing protein n=1 Tax=Flagellimonas chongwuensis TaxID=2697365 RepID=A0A850NAF4_9FLAO|nr:DUF2306 domain-containing protein [Allomuricauda chongwuensis]NVN17623.1 DUF2306 domain-containing protein [Allomuricauda chongwuensis]
MKAKRILTFIFWTIIIAISVYFYYYNVFAYFYGYRNERFGTTLFTNQIWFVAHMVGATFSLFLGPVQFWPSVRKKYIRYHRMAGKLYIVGSLIAGISALRLSLINDCAGCRYPLFLLSVLFLLTTACAWIAIRRKNIVAHQQFMTRSYTLALAFVFVRLYQILPLDFLYGPIHNAEVERTVNEWIFSFVPLIIVEIVMIWLPSLKKTRRANHKQ